MCFRSSGRGGDQFGGEYWGDNPWKSIWINNYGCIHMTAADITVNEPTRALFVEGGAQFDVGEGRIVRMISDCSPNMV